VSILDIIIIIILLVGAYRGFKKGLLKSFVAVIAFILAIIGSFKLLHLAIGMLVPLFGDLNGMIPYVSFVLLFISIILLVTLIGNAVKKVLDLTLLGNFDNIAGAFLGLLKWAFGLSILLWLTVTVGIDIPDHLEKNAVVYPYLLSFGPKVVNHASAIMPFASDLLHSIQGLLQKKIV
jgi:membrane protein required for colicin V production